MPVSNQLNVKTWQTRFTSSLSSPSFLPLLAYVSLPLFGRLSALWCQFPVLAFTRQMLVCHTLSLIPHTHTHTHTHTQAQAEAWLNARVSAGLSNRVSVCRDLLTWQNRRTHTHTHTQTDIDTDQVETCRDAQSHTVRRGN